MHKKSVSFVSLVANITIWYDHQVKHNNMEHWFNELLKLYNFTFADTGSWSTSEILKVAQPLDQDMWYFTYFKESRLSSFVIQEIKKKLLLYWIRFYKLLSRSVYSQYHGCWHLDDINSHYFELFSPEHYSLTTRMVKNVTYNLTHWGRDEMNNISQTTLSNVFSSMKMFEFRLKFHWSLFPRVQLTIFQHWFR